MEKYDKLKVFWGVLLLIAFYLSIVEFSYWLYNGDDVPPAQVEEIIKF